MSPLTRRDGRRLLDAIAVLESEVDAETFPARAVAAFGVIIDADLASYNEVDVAARVNRFLMVPDVAAAQPGSAAHDAFLHHMDEHPLIAHYRRSATLTPRTISDFLSLRQFRALGLHAAFFQVVGVHYQMAVVLERGRSRQIAVALNRVTRDFSERDRAVADVLRPHASRHYRMCVTVADLCARVRGQCEAGAAVGTSIGTPHGLTPREAQILHWVSLGLRNEDVACRIGTRPLTVKKHLEHIYAKLGVHNRTAAVMKMASTSAGATSLR